MPKGDRLKLKADPEDGTTPIANLLLEAVAMVKLSGLQKGAIIFLWRKTYGWVDKKNGKRLKEAKIGLTEWARALDSSNSRLSRTLSELQDKGIIKRRIADTWGGYYYSLNTNVKSWNSDCINLVKLSEIVGVPDFATVDQNATVDKTDNSCGKDNSCPNGQQLRETTTPSPTPKKGGVAKLTTVDQNDTQQLTKTTHPTLYKETLKKDIKKEDDKNLSSPLGIKVKEVFARLDKLRGYRPPKRKAEAASIIRMLKDYTPDQIIKAWEILKQDKFWCDKELFMMSVETQIGAIINRGKKSKPSKYGDGW